MAKIGTAHVEIKPVLADGALDEIMKRVEDAVAEGVRRGLDRRVAVHLDGRTIAKVVAESNKREDNQR